MPEGNVMVALVGETVPAWQPLTAQVLPVGIAELNDARFGNANTVGTCS
jgi:hypothetical protein